MSGRTNMNLIRTTKCLLRVLAAALIASSAGDGYAQGAKMTVGQTGTNPGTALYFIAQKENLFSKHGLNVNIVKTNTATNSIKRCGRIMCLAVDYRSRRALSPLWEPSIRTFAARQSSASLVAVNELYDSFRRLPSFYRGRVPAIRSWSPIVL